MYQRGVYENCGDNRRFVRDRGGITEQNFCIIMKNDDEVSSSVNSFSGETDALR